MCLLYIMPPQVLGLCVLLWGFSDIGGSLHAPSNAFECAFIFGFCFESPVPELPHFQQFPVSFLSFSSHLLFPFCRRLFSPRNPTRNSVNMVFSMFAAAAVAACTCCCALSPHRRLDAAALRHFVLEGRIPSALELRLHSVYRAEGAAAVRKSLVGSASLFSSSPICLPCLLGFLVRELLRPQFCF